MTNNILWSPKNKNNYLSDFINNLKKSKFIKDNNYDLLHKWSISNKKEFWKAVWDFTNIIGKFSKPVLVNEKNFIKSIFFKNSKLNYTENILVKKNNEDAIIFYSEKNIKRKISWKELSLQTNKIAFFL